MKKTYCYFALYVSILLGAFAMTSCGSDPDSNPYNVINNNAVTSNGVIVKKLMSQKWTGQDVDYDETSTFTQTWVIYFINDHQGVCKYTAIDRDAYLGSDRRYEDYPFTYTINDRHITVTPDFTGGFDFHDSFFTWSGTMFSPSALTESDREYIEEWTNQLTGRNNGPIDIKISFPKDNELLNFSRYDDDSDVYEYRFTLDLKVENAYDAHKNGADKVILTIWADNGWGPSAKKLTSSYLGDEEEVVLKLPSEDSYFYDQFYMFSLSHTLNFHYKIEYTNRYDGKTYVVKEKLLTLRNGSMDEHNASKATYEYGVLKVDGVQYKMVRVSGGRFQMGATSEQGSDANYDEKPVHNVTLSSYYIGQTEVTQALWQAVMGSNPSKFKGDNLPVEQVSWNDCQRFIVKLNELTGAKFRLPTEAEWEYAARGGSLSRGYKYSGSNTASDVAWYWDNGGKKTHPVATKQANELGLYDMSGNVFEWCQDKYGFYSDSDQTNPTGDLYGSQYVKRGGTWSYYMRACRVSFREHNTSTNSYYNLGFRLAL